MIYLSPACHEYYSNNSLCPLVEHGSSHKISLKKMKQQTTETDLEHHHDAACLQKFTSDLPMMVDWNFSTAFFCASVPENEVFFFSRRSGKDRNLWGSQNPNTALLSLLTFLVFQKLKLKNTHTIHGTDIFAYILPLKKITVHVGNYTGLMDPVDELTPGIPSWARGPSCHRSSFWPGAVAVSQDGRYDLVSHRIHGANGLFTYMNG